MDKKKLVKEIRISLNKFIDNVCEVNMAMLIKDVNTETYTFILSAKFFELLNEYDALKLVAEHFYKDLSKDTFSKISRINIVSISDITVQIILKTFSMKRGTTFINDCNFFGVQIDDAIILESDRN